MYVYRTFDMTNKSLKCKLMYWCEFFLFLLMPWTLDIALLAIGIIFVQPFKIACSMDLQHLQHTLFLAKLAFSVYQILVGKFP